MGVGHAPDAQRGLRDHEFVLQLAHQHLGQLGRGGGAQQRARPAVQAVGNGHVVLAVADHLDQLVLQALDFFAQHFHLPLLQRHRTLPVRAGQLHGGQQLRMALEEAGRLGQEIRDVFFRDALDTHSSISPSKTVSAGPVISTWAPWPPTASAGHSTVSTPPRGVHIHAAVQPAQADAGHHGRAGTGAAGQGFAGVALEHAQRDLVARHHLHEAGVHLARKARVFFHQGAQFGHRGLAHIAHALHRVRVAHGQHGHVHVSLFPAQWQRPQVEVAHCAGTSGRWRQKECARARRQARSCPR